MTIDNQNQNNTPAPTGDSLTPEQSARFAGYSDKLKAMVAERPTSVPPARTFTTRDAAAVSAKQSEQTPAQKRIAELNAPESDLWSKDETKQKAAYAELRKLLAEDAGQDEKDAYANLPLSQLRERYGLDEPKLPTEDLRERWDREQEAIALVALHEQGVAPETARDLHGWYVRQAIANQGNFTEADAVAFREFASKRGLSSEFIEKLISWHGGVE